jgi:hypothetical protein
MMGHGYQRRKVVLGVCLTNVLKRVRKTPIKYAIGDQAHVQPVLIAKTAQQAVQRLIARLRLDG